MALWAYDPFTHSGPQAQKGPGLGLTLYCCILKFLILFGQGGPMLSFGTDLANYVVSSVFRISELVGKNWIW